MGWFFSKRETVAKGTTVNVSKSGASVSKKMGPLTVNSRGRASIRVAPGLSFRFGGKKRR